MCVRLCICVMPRHVWNLIIIRCTGGGDVSNFIDDDDG